MRLRRRLLFVILALLILSLVWLWWNRPQKVDMTGYVPADALVYLEANDLPRIAGGLAETDAWRALAEPAGVRSGLGQVRWLSRVVAWTGIGTADAVVLARAQLAVAVFGFDAAEAEGTLKIKPRYAVVAETHTSAWRTRSAIEKRVGDFARRAYGEPRVERKTIDDVEFTTWVAPDGERRIVTALMEGMAVIGTDEDSVRACLAAKRGERPSLAGNGTLADMRRRVGGEDAAAFGYVSAAGTSKLLEVAATVYAPQLTPDPRAQSAAASMLPSLANKTLGAAGWAAHFSSGAVEDRYFLALENGVGARLRSALASAPPAGEEVGGFVPANTYSLSRYNYRDPAAAWRGLNAVLSSQFDALGAVFVGRLLESALKPYGIEEPNAFLSAIGPEIATARLDNTGQSTVTIVEVRDEAALKRFVAKRLGPNPRAERIGVNEMLVSKEEKRGAACFVAGRLLMGAAHQLRRCLEAQAGGRTLAAEQNFQKAGRGVATGEAANAVTYTDDTAAARTFIKALAAQRGIGTGAPGDAALAPALAALAYAVSETTFIDGGIERRTRSSFGQFGTLAAQFTPGTDQ